MSNAPSFSFIRDSSLSAVQNHPNECIARNKQSNPEHHHIAVVAGLWRIGGFSCLRRISWLGWLNWLDRVRLNLRIGHGHISVVANYVAIRQVATVCRSVNDRGSVLDNRPIRHAAVDSCLDSHRNGLAICDCRNGPYTISRIVLFCRIGAYQG